MDYHTFTNRLLFGAGCLVVFAGHAVAGSDLSTEGAHVSLSQPEDEAAEAVAEDPGWWQQWEGSFELGLNGSSGNNENFNFRAAVGASREDDETIDEINLLYSYANSDGEQTENRFAADARHTWKLDDSPWQLYIGGSYEYDEFQDWDHRVSVGPGVGYQLIDNDRTDLLLRAGIQATREFGGTDDKWRPEGVLGFDLAHQITERQSLEVTFDFYPSLDPVGPYRFEGDAAWKIEVDPESNLYLRLGIEDRYDSSPGPGKKRNDVSYYATVGWTF